VLAAASVKRIYGIVGDSLKARTDSRRRQGKSALDFIELEQKSSGFINVERRSR
jgi:hypothetical protein